MTPRQQKQALERERRRHFRQQQRELIASLRVKVRDTRVARRAARRNMRERCKAHRHAARENARALRLRLLHELRAAVHNARAQGRAQCARDHAQARELATAAERARAELAAEREFQKELRRIEAWNRAGHQAIKRGRHASLSQSDDAVRANIPPEMHALWERVKGRIRGGERKSRTEAFFQYAEENPAEVLEAMGDRSDEVIAQLQADTRRATRARRQEHLPEAPF